MRAWYGKAFYFVELPRRFMVSIWGIPVFWNILPEQWMAVIVAIACIAYDVFITSRAPDLCITKEQIQSKLSQSGGVYFLTKSELVKRIVVITAIFAVLIAFLWYWFSHNQEPTLITRAATATLILIAVAYISWLGTPMRTTSEIPTTHTPFTFSIMPAESKVLLLYMFGWPFWIWMALLILYVVMWGMGSPPPEISSNGLGFTGSFESLLFCFGFGYYLFLICVISMPMAIFNRKIKFINKE